MTTVTELTGEWHGPTMESLGECVNQVMMFRGLADFYEQREMWAEHERSEMTSLDYQLAVTNKMIAMELLYVAEGPYAATLVWLEPGLIGGRWWARVEKIGETE